MGGEGWSSKVGWLVLIASFKIQCHSFRHMEVSKVMGIPLKSSILVGFWILKQPFWGTSIYGNTHIQTFSNTQNSCERHSTMKHRSPSEPWRGYPQSTSYLMFSNRSLFHTSKPNEMSRIIWRFPES